MFIKITNTLFLLICLSVNITIAQPRSLNKANIEWLNFNNTSAVFPLDSHVPPDQSKFALLIGIDDYKEDGIQDLKGAVNSVFRFKELLIDKFQFTDDSKNIKILCNGKLKIKTKYDGDAPCTESATAANIEKWFREILIENAKKNPNATFVFQAVTHGSQRQDEVNGDEPDKLDETLVTWDSRDKEGKNFDLTDDKLFELIKELATHTKNVLYVIDSCHSGTINRGTATALEISSDNRPQPKKEQSAENSKGDSQDQELLPSNDRYVMITGADSGGLAYQLENENYTALSYYLIEAMKDAKPETSYEDLMNDVVRGVRQNNFNQRPQIIGDRLRSVLDGTAVDQDSYIRISPNGIDKNQLKIDAGETTGIKINNIVAVYDKNKLKFVGKDGRKAIGKVTDLKPTSATVTFTFEPGINCLDDRDKVVLLSPLFGSPQINVGLVSLNGTAAPPASRDMNKKIRESPILEGSKLIRFENLSTSEVIAFKNGKLPAKFTKAGEFPTVLVKRGTLGEAFLNKKPSKKVADTVSITGYSYVTDDTPDKTEIFYLTDSGGEPLLDFYVKTVDQEAADKITDTLLKLARQRNLTALENKQSPLGRTLKSVGDKQKEANKTSIIDKVEVQFLKVEIGKNSEGKKIIKSEQAITPDELFMYDSYLMQITNKSSQKLYVYLLNISTDGSIAVMYPEINCPAAEIINPGTSVKMAARAYRLTPPLGFERYKLIVSTSDEPSPAICYLQQGATTKNGLNPLEVLVDEALTGNLRNGAGGDVDSWGTADLTIEIKPRP